MLYWVALLMAGAVVGIIAAARVTARHRQKAFDERLRTPPVHDLAAEIATTVVSAGWDRLEPGAALQCPDARTEKNLLDGLDALLEALMAEDEEKGQTGRDSNYFNFYDLGLARVSEALRDRLGIPQPWQKSPG